MTTEWENKVTLSGFYLEPAEKAIVDNLIRNYQNKLKEKVGFKEIKIRLKKAEHGRAFLHEVRGELITDRRFSAEAKDYNLFAAMSEVFEKLMNEAEHKKRTSRQI